MQSILKLLERGGKTPLRLKTTGLAPSTGQRITLVKLVTRGIRRNVTQQVRKPPPLNSTMLFGWEWNTYRQFGAPKGALQQHRRRRRSGLGAAHDTNELIVYALSLHIM